jgi:hypothetical protein
MARGRITEDDVKKARAILYPWIIIFVASIVVMALSARVIATEDPHSKIAIAHLCLVRTTTISVPCS